MRDVLHSNAAGGASTRRAFGRLALSILALAGLPAAPAGAAGFHLTDPSSPIYRTLAAAACTS
jgi:hypothetical protein